MSRWRKLITILVCCLSTITFSGCSYKGYTGEYPELFTVAINCIPDAEGYLVSETQHQPVVMLIEKDEYGRKMFCYIEKIFICNLIICQFADEENAYYYAECNYFSKEIFDNIWGGDYQLKVYANSQPATIDNPLNDFTDEEIEELKQKNDWGQELDLEKCEKAPIVRIKE